MAMPKIRLSFAKKKRGEEWALNPSIPKEPLGPLVQLSIQIVHNQFDG